MFVICINYSRIEGANIAPIKLALVFLEAKLEPTVLVESLTKGVEIGPLIVIALRLQIHWLI